MLASGCHQAADPGALFRSISGDYLHGELELARERAARARADFSAGSAGRDATWELQFRLLEAEILLRQDRPKEALALLSVPGSSIPTQGDLAIKYNLLSGTAHARLPNSQGGDQELREARAGLRQSPIRR